MLISQNLRDQLIANQVLCDEGHDAGEMKPVAYLKHIATGYSWLLVTLDQDNLLFGLADLGCPEMGSIYLPELEELGGIVVVEPFNPDKTLYQYWRISRKHQTIVV